MTLVLLGSTRQFKVDQGEEDVNITNNLKTTQMLTHGNLYIAGESGGDEIVSSGTFSTESRAANLSNGDDYKGVLFLRLLGGCNYTDEK